MRLRDIPIDPTCGERHLGRCNGLTFRQRLLSIRISPEATPTRKAVSYYDDDLVTHQFGGLTRKERVEDYLDATKGYGAAETQPNGDVIARDPKTKEKRKLSPDEVDRVYLGG